MKPPSLPLSTAAFLTCPTAAKVPNLSEAEWALTKLLEIRGFKEWQERYRVKDMPSRHTWQQAPSPVDLYFNSNTIVPRNHHYPHGGLNTSISSPLPPEW
jgi:hypothetical protein